MDSAPKMNGTILAQADGTWSYTWSWRYSGSERLDDVHEEFVLTNASGMVIDYKVEPSHSAEPGQTYSGGGSGKQVPPGQVYWSLRILQGGKFLGMTGSGLGNLTT